MKDGRVGLPECGCWLDGTYGDLFPRIIDLARAYGWDAPEQIDNEWLDEAACAAVEYLNDVLAGEDVIFQLEDGCLILAPINEGGDYESY